MRGVAIALTLAGCAAPQPLSPPDPARDGTYVGTRTQDPACGIETHRIVLQVAGTRIAVHSRHASQDLAGTINPDGGFALQDGDGKRHIDGLIRDGHLVATEPDAPGNVRRHRRSGGDDPTALTCTWRYEATRTPG